MADKSWSGSYGPWRLNTHGYQSQRSLFRTITKNMPTMAHTIEVPLLLNIIIQGPSPWYPLRARPSSLFMGLIVMMESILSMESDTILSVTSIICIFIVKIVLLLLKRPTDCCELKLTFDN